MVSEVFVETLLGDFFATRQDVTVFPTFATRLILTNQNNYHEFLSANPRYSGIQAPQSSLFSRRYAVFIIMADVHFMGVIVDWESPSKTAYNITYLDSFKSRGDKYLAPITAYLTWMHISAFPLAPSPTWTIDRTRTAHMERQRPYRKPDTDAWDATHIECGIYVILMVPLCPRPHSILDRQTVHLRRTYASIMHAARKHNVAFITLIDKEEQDLGSNHA